MYHANIMSQVAITAVSYFFPSLATTTMSYTSSSQLQHHMLATKSMEVSIQDTGEVLTAENDE